MHLLDEKYSKNRNNVKNLNVIYTCGGNAEFFIINYIILIWSLKYNLNVENFWVA